MSRYFYLLLVLVVLTFSSALAQKELPYTAINLTNLQDFKTASGNWKVVGDVFFDANRAGKSAVQKGAGIVINTPSAKNQGSLSTNLQHGDLDLELDFMMDKGSDDGVFLQGRYEIQLADSWGVMHPKVTDCGAISQRWDDSKSEGSKGYEGHVPSQNVCKAPGLWQHLRIEFRSPRFNEKGEKIQNARFVKVVLNGVTVHENIELGGPTKGAGFQDEKPLGPLMLEAGQGAVAFRNIKYKAYGTNTVTLAAMKLNSYEGTINSFDDLNSTNLKRQMPIDLLAHAAPGSKEKFAGKITGTIDLPASGTYLLNLDLRWIPAETNPEKPNGAGELIIGDQKILNIDGKKGGTATATVELKAGKYPLTLNYYKNSNLWYAKGNDIILGIEGPGLPYTNLNPIIPEVDPVGQIKVLAKNEPLMLRGFVNQGNVKKTHVISVAEPGLANYSFDLRKGEFMQFWRGDFMETTQMWHDRGETQLAVPLGSVIELPAKPSVTILADKNASWPDSNASYNYIGYDVEQGRPVIKYSLGNSSIKESFTGEENGKRLVHTITVDQENKELWNIAAEGSSIEKLPNGLYAINNKQYYLDLGDIKDAVIRNSAGNSKELIVPVHRRVSYSIIW